jgi:hypothetical protein
MVNDSASRASNANPPAPLVAAAFPANRSPAPPIELPPPPDSVTLTACPSSPAPAAELGGSPERSGWRRVLKARYTKWH